MALNTPFSLILPRYRWRKNRPTRHPAARRAGEAPTVVLSERDAGGRRWGDNGADRRCPAAFRAVPSHAALARKKLPSLNRRNDHAALIRLGLPEPPAAGRGLCRSDRRLPLYGVSPADTGAVPTSAGQVGCMVTDGSRRPMLIDQPEFCNDPCNRVPQCAPSHGATATIEDRRDQVIEKNGRRNTKCTGAGIGGKWGRRVVRVLYQTKAPLVRRTLKCERRGLERQDDNE